MYFLIYDVNDIIKAIVLDKIFIPLNKILFILFNGMTDKNKDTGPKSIKKNSQTNP